MRRRTSAVLSFKKPQTIMLRDKPMDDFLDVVVRTFKPDVQQHIHLELFTLTDQAITIDSEVGDDQFMLAAEWTREGIHFDIYYTIQVNVLHPIIDVLCEERPRVPYYVAQSRYYRAYVRGQGALRLVWDTDFVYNGMTHRVEDYPYGHGRSRRHYSPVSTDKHPDPVEREIAALESITSE